ncbi:MAG: polysaccharide deacetylase family protein, partial [Tabrizicola sp.]|nr:polysaccharide deacetylase family protein [Tabrizicola sp.]
MPPAFEALSAALSRRSTPAVFWWRDDDAVAPTSALDRLLDLSTAHAAPCLLAVIPKPTGPELASRLGRAPLVKVGVHGWSHENHAPAGSKKAELGPQRPARVQLEELRQGLEKLQALYPKKLVPVLVPPWNRIDPALIPGLSGLGFGGISVYGPE